MLVILSDKHTYMHTEYTLLLGSKMIIKIVILMSVFGYGIIFSILGALKLELTKELQIDNTRVGGLISALMFSSLIVVLVAGPLVDLFGHKPLITTGCFIGFLALSLLAAARSYIVAVLACILLGLAGMCLNIVGNTLLPVYLFGGTNAPAALNLGNTFFGLGAFSSPFLIGILLKRFGYRFTGQLIASIFLIMLFVAAFAPYPDIMHQFTLSRALTLLTEWNVIVPSLALFCFLGLEVSMAGWLTSYASNLGFTDRSASMTLSGFWVCMIISRLLASVVLNPTISSQAAMLLALLSAITIGLMMIARSKRFAVALIFGIGFIFGPIFPTIIGIAFLKTPYWMHGSVFGIVSAMGLLGASIVPASIGWHSRNNTIQNSLKIALVVAFLLLIMTVAMGYI